MLWREGGRGDKTFHLNPGTMGNRAFSLLGSRGPPHRSHPAKPRPAWVLTWPTEASHPGSAWQPNWSPACLGAPDSSAHPALLWIQPIPSRPHLLFPTHLLGVGLGCISPELYKPYRDSQKCEAGPLGKEISPAQKGRPEGCQEKPHPLLWVPSTCDKEDC